MLNANYDYDRNTARNLVYPTGTEGWKTVGALYNGLAGYLSWKDAKDRAARIDEAQNDYYNTLKNYLNRQEAPVETAESYEVPQPEVTPEAVRMNAATQQAVQTGGDAADYAYRMALARRKQEEDQKNNLAKALIGG